MSHRKIPEDAFTYYFSLGLARSYAEVAKRYGVTKRAVVSFAVRDRWQDRLKEIERKSRERGDARASEGVDEMNDRHLRIARAVQSKAIEALQHYPLTSALAAVRALEASVRQERLVRGEPIENETGGSVGDVIRREYERWLASGVAEADGDAKRDDDPDAALELPG